DLGGLKMTRSEEPIELRRQRLGLVLQELACDVMEERRRRLVLEREVRELRARLAAYEVTDGSSHPAESRVELRGVRCGGLRSGREATGPRDLVASALTGTDAASAQSRARTARSIGRRADPCCTCGYSHRRRRRPTSRSVSSLATCSTPCTW